MSDIRFRQAFLILLLRPKPDPPGEYVAQIVRQTFVDPEQVASHRLLIVTSGEAGGAAIFTIP